MEVSKTGWYVTRPGTPAREAEERCARELGLVLRTLKPVEAAARALLPDDKASQ